MTYRCTPEVREKVAQYVRAGGFTWVAAEAAGVPKPTFEEWMRRGWQSARPPYRAFRDAVLQARAEARLKAEIETRGKFPRDWLRMGPGRERPGRPGWSQPPKAEAYDSTNAGGDLRHTLLILQHVLELVRDQPEKRAEIAGRVGEIGDNVAAQEAS